MSESSTIIGSIQSAGARLVSVNKRRNDEDIDIFNASIADYITTAVFMFIGSIIYFSVRYSKMFESMRERFTQCKTQLLVNTYMKDSETVHSSYKEPATLFQRTIQFLFSFDDNTPSPELDD